MGFLNISQAHPPIFPSLILIQQQWGSAVACIGKFVVELDKDLSELSPPSLPIQWALITLCGEGGAVGRSKIHRKAYKNVWTLINFAVLAKGSSRSECPTFPKFTISALGNSAHKKSALKNELALDLRCMSTAGERERDRFLFPLSPSLHNRN